MPLNGLNRRKFPLYMWFITRSTGMQLTTLPGGGTTRRTGDRAYLFGREIFLLHVHRMQLHAIANLYNFGHFLAFVAKRGRRSRS